MEPVLAAAAVRTLPRTARLMPMKPVRPDRRQPSRKARVRNMPDWTKLSASVCPSAFSTATEVSEDHDEQRDEDQADRAELPLQVGHGALLDGLGDLLHLRRALVLGEHAPHEQEADGDGEQGGQRGADEDEPLAAVQREVLVAALGGKYWVHRMSLWDRCSWHASGRPRPVGLHPALGSQAEPSPRERGPAAITTWEDRRCPAGPDGEVGHDGPGLVVQGRPGAVPHGTTVVGPAGGGRGHPPQRWRRSLQVLGPGTILARR